MINIYININTVLSKGCTWNIIEGERSIGKTYGSEYLVLNNCIKKNRELIYLVRTQEEVKDGVLQDAFQKVIDEKFSNYEFYFETDSFGIIENEIKRRLAICLALSQAHKIKRKSFPKVYWIILDELQLETSSTVRYVNGFKEVELLLSIFHTVDRETGRVRVIMLSNSISMINPYYIHDFFKIPKYPIINKYYIKNDVLYIKFSADEELEEKRKTDKFISKIRDLEYGKYVSSENLEDNEKFISARVEKDRLLFNIVVNKVYYGLWLQKNNFIIISKKHDKNLPSYALDEISHDVDILLLDKKDSYISYMIKCIKNNFFRYECLEVKNLIEKSLYKIL